MIFKAPPSLDDIAALAQQSWDAMPAAFRQLAAGIIFRVEDLADEETLVELGIEDPFELSGLYQGVDLTHQSIADPAPTAPIVFLFRRAILDEWIRRYQLGRPRRARAGARGRPPFRPQRRADGRNPGA